MDKNLKIKLSIFGVLALVGIFIIAYTAIENREKITKLEAQQNQQLKEKQNEMKLEQDKAQKQEEDRKKREQELKDKYDRSFEAFHGKKYNLAIQLSDEILAVDPNYYMALNLKGIALCYSKNFEDGMSFIDKALAIKPDYGYARFNKALAYELFGKYDESLTWYDKALEVEDYVWSYYGKASIYGRKGDIANTVKYLKKAIEMNPDVKNVAKSEEDFNPVRNFKEFKELVEQ